MSLLTHVTFVPFLMVSADGLNEKFLISTVALDTAVGSGVFETEAAGVNIGVVNGCWTLFLPII